MAVGVSGGFRQRRWPPPLRTPAQLPERPAGCTSSLVIRTFFRDRSGSDASLRFVRKTHRSPAPGPLPRVLPPRAARSRRRQTLRSVRYRRPPGAATPQTPRRVRRAVRQSRRHRGPARAHPDRAARRVRTAGGSTRGRRATQHRAAPHRAAARSGSSGTARRDRAAQHRTTHRKARQLALVTRGAGVADAIRDK